MGRKKRKRGKQRKLFENSDKEKEEKEIGFEIKKRK